MKHRELGRQDLSVSAIGLGCMGLSDFYFSSRTDEFSGIDLIRHGLDLGVDFLDIADIYGPFTNEGLIDDLRAWNPKVVAEN